MTTGEQIAAMAAAVWEPDDVIEVRLLPLRQSTWFKARGLSPQPAWGGQNVYFGINPRSKSGAKDASGVKLARCLFVDVDNCTLDQAMERLKKTSLRPPTCVVSTGGGVHFYWRLEEPMLDLNLWTRHQRSLIAAIGGDPLCHDAPRIARAPGTMNIKRGVMAKLEAP